ncbi:dolichyl-phosphate-mannose-protein mannosyltransferase family protein [Desulfovibrio sp. X2]|uniref:glycosyltransferase family 39 protein n=1 Tax=Desulfovibrio sp. X2 TaxID=941449 RepID=UPI0003589B4E|nr:glycosyltransferase family 39 protein [Desulfovibrio sp. X2]EPR42785.1 dolichyl-phosphate-mannose-protein mannosyltransferase family protein [Desulfovibrio sp. X2]
MLKNTLRFIWELARSRPYIFLLVVLTLQALPMIAGHRGLWFSDEVRYAGAFREMLNGHWLVLHLNGEMYPDKPPVYFWFLGLVSLFTGKATPTMFYLGATISAAIYLLASCVLSRAVAKEGKDVTLLSGLILLSTYYFIGLSQYSRMDLLFAAFIMASQACLYLGTRDDEPSRLVPLGFLFCALATLTKGPFGLAFPLLAIVIFLAWTGRLGRLARRDAGIGALILLVILAAWAGGSRLVEGPAYLQNIFHKQIYERALHSWHHEEPWWHYLATLPLVWLPWTMILFCLPWKRLTLERMIDIWGARREAGGKTFLWVVFLSEFLLLSSVQTKIVIYALPLFAPAAILMAGALFDLSEARSRRFWSLSAAVMALLALAVPFFEVGSPWPIPVGGTGVVFLCLGLTAFVLWRLRGAEMRLAALALCVGVTVSLVPLGLMTIPSLDAAMSPKAQALAMKEYVERGYAPAAFNVYAGIYTFYADTDYFETQDVKAMAAFLAEHPTAVVAFKKKDYLAYKDDFPPMRVVQEQWIVDRPYVLVVKDSVAQAGTTAEPAADEAGAALGEEAAKAEQPEAAAREKADETAGQPADQKVEKPAEQTPEQSPAQTSESPAAQ